MYVHNLSWKNISKNRKYAIGHAQGIKVSDIKYNIIRRMYTYTYVCRKQCKRMKLLQMDIWAKELNTVFFTETCDIYIVAMSIHESSVHLSTAMSKVKKVYREGHAWVTRRLNFMFIRLRQFVKPQLFLEKDWLPGNTAELIKGVLLYKNAAFWKVVLTDI